MKRRLDPKTGHGQHVALDQPMTRRELPDYLRPGLGVVFVGFNPGDRSSSDLRAADYRDGVPQLIAKLKRFRPRAVAFNGKVAYEMFSGHPARLGLQRETLAGAHIFVLPSTSGRNGSLTRARKLTYFKRLARWVKTT
jgi:double-stranded uracil-DNA glycosylase